MSYNLTAAAFGGNQVYSRAGGATLNLVTGGAATTFTPQNITYSVSGKMYFGASGTIGTASPTTDGVTLLAFRPVTPNQGCVFVWCLNAASAIKVVQGPLSGANSVDDSGNWINPPQFPAIPDTLTPISYSVVRAASTASAAGWLLGTNNFASVTGITVATAVDIALLPATPQTS